MSNKANTNQNQKIIMNFCGGYGRKISVMRLMKYKAYHPKNVETCCFLTNYCVCNHLVRSHDIERCHIQKKTFKIWIKCVIVSKFSNLINEHSISYNCYRVKKNLKLLLQKTEQIVIWGDQLTQYKLENPSPTFKSLFKVIAFSHNPIIREDLSLQKMRMVRTKVK